MSLLLKRILCMTVSQQQKSMHANVKSKLDSSVNMSYSQRGGKRGTGSLDVFEPIPGTNSLRIAPRLTYNFSRALNGAFFIDYSRTFSEATNQTTTLVRVGLNATFTF